MQVLHKQREKLKFASAIYLTPDSNANRANKSIRRILFH
jgi:hypothetical protein